MNHNILLWNNDALQYEFLSRNSAWCQKCNQFRTIEHVVPEEDEDDTEDDGIEIEDLHFSFLTDEMGTICSKCGEWKGLIFPSAFSKKRMDQYAKWAEKNVA